MTPTQSSTSVYLAMVKRSVIATIIAFFLFLPTLGIKTAASGGVSGLFLQYRWTLLAVGCGFIFFVRMAMEIFGQRHEGQPKTDKAPSALNIFLGSSKVAKAVGPLLLVFAVAFPFLPFSDRYILDLGILIITYVMLGWGLQIVVGLAGLLDLGYVAFYAVGAYSYALLSIHFGFGFWLCLPLAGVLAATWGVMLGFPVLRLRGDYLAIVTLAFGEIIRIILLNWRSFTGGSNGISSIPRPSFFGLPFNQEPGGFAATFGLEYSTSQRIIFLYFLILALAIFTFFVTARLRRLPIGRAWEALREDEIACRSLGINTVNTKLSAFAIGAMFGGFAGSFFAAKQAFVSPESFNFMESATILAIVVLGGMSSQLGVVFSAIAMVGGVELLRQLQFLKVLFGPDFDPSQLRLLLFGLAMILMMLWRPRGLVSTRTPTVFLKDEKAVSAAMISQGRG
jgi:branched-chain amino acid transport system permease protein